MHRKAGIAGLAQRREAEERFKQRGGELSKAEQDKVESELSLFRSQLENFAIKHKGTINKDPVFRSQFNEMCRQTGVDPLNSAKGFWAVLGMTDFYYELAVQVVEVCMQTRDSNGGLIELNVLYELLKRKRGSVAPQISSHDIEYSLSTLKTLGNGFSVKKIGTRLFVQSVPMELSQDEASVIELCEKNGFVSVTSLSESLKWPSSRCEQSLNHLLQECLLWVDVAPDGSRSYWSPSRLGL